MKIATIDIGSNSVRLGLSSGGKTLYKRIITTRLGEGLSLTGCISQAAMVRTAEAVHTFKMQAEAEGVQKLCVFATAAVRSASNGAEFVDYVKAHYGVDIDVVSGETEAKIGLLGALGGKDGGIIDLGGASCEVTVSEGGSTLYAKSLDVGAVRLLDICGRDRVKLEAYIGKKLPEYGVFDASGVDMYGISGTATTLAAVKHALAVYDPEIVHGTQITVEEMGALADRFLKMSVEDIKRVAGMATWRADVIGGASLFLYRLLQHFNISKITVSESDNLEGYLIYKGLV